MTMEPAWRILDPNSPQPVRDRQLAINRRQFFSRGATGIGTAALDHPPGRRCSVRGRRRQGQLTGLSQRVQVKYGTIVLPVVDRHRHVGAARERLLDRALKLRMDGVMQVVQEEYGSVKRRMRGGIHDGSVGSL